MGKTSSGSIQHIYPNPYPSLIFTVLKLDLMEQQKICISNADWHLYLYISTTTNK